MAFKLQERSSNFRIVVPVRPDSMQAPPKVYLLASPKKSLLQKIKGRFSLYPDIWHSGGIHWAVVVWFPNKEYVRCEPGVHNSSLRGHLQAGNASAEKDLALPGEHQELVGAVNVTREDLFDFFKNYRGERTLQPTAQRDWVAGFLSKFPDLKSTDIEAPVERLQAQVR